MTKVHATCVAIKGRGVLITGRSGSGKSDLALRLIDRGAALVSDDYVELQVDANRLIASPPETIAGKIEIRGLGIMDVPFVEAAPIHLAIDLDTPPERFPLEPHETEYLGISLALVRLSAHEASAPIKVEYAVELYGQ